MYPCFLFAASNILG